MLEEEVQRQAEKLKDNSSMVREQAVMALGTIGGDSAMAALIEALQDEDSDVRQKAAEALGKVGEQAYVRVHDLQDLDKGVRQRAASALSREISPTAKAAVPALARALKDDD